MFDKGSSFPIVVPNQMILEQVLAAGFMGMPTSAAIAYSVSIMTRSTSWPSNSKFVNLLSTTLFVLASVVFSMIFVTLGISD
jgi:hypothetical protein